MRRRRPDVDEVLLPLEEDDAEPAPDGRIVELGPGAGNRRRDLGLLLAVVALVAGIGFLGDGGDQEELAEADATTTTTPRRTTSTPRRPTTTTTLPTEPLVTSVEGTGPVVPGTTTGSAIVSTDGDELVVLDLDTGRQCRVEVPGARSDGLWVGRGLGDRANVNGNRGSLTVTSRCELSGPQQAGVAELLPSERPGHAWEMRHLDHGVRLVERADDGTPSGREVDIPVWSGGIHPVRGGFVTDVFGSVAFVDAATGEARELTNGVTLAAAGDALAVMDCQAFDCPVVVLDLDGREVFRRTASRPAFGWQGGAISPDGRWLAYLTAGEAGVPTTALVDLATGAERDLGRSDGGSPVAFTATSSHVAVRTTRGFQLVPVGGGEPVDLDALTPRSQPFAVIDRAPDAA